MDTRLGLSLCLILACTALVGCGPRELHEMAQEWTLESDYHKDRIGPRQYTVKTEGDMHMPAAKIRGTLALQGAQIAREQGYRYFTLEQVQQIDTYTTFKTPVYRQGMHYVNRKDPSFVYQKETFIDQTPEYTGIVILQPKAFTGCYDTHKILGDPKEGGNNLNNLFDF